MVESIQLNMDKIQHQKSNDYQSSSYIQEIKCKLLEKTIINDKNIKVTLRNLKPIETGFFSSNYIIFEVYTEITNDLNWNVHRRYSDFIWLRQTLRNYFPRLFIPPIPGKNLVLEDLKLILLKKECIF